MGKKKDAALHGLTKKQRRKLEERAAHEAAEAKVRKKAKKKSRDTKARTEKTGDDAERHPALKHLDRVGELDAIANDKTAKKSARKEAKAELERLRAEGQARIDAKDAEAAPEQTAEQIDAAIRARLEAKRAKTSVDPDGPGSPERLAKMQADVAADRAAREKAAADLTSGADDAPQQSPEAEAVILAADKKPKKGKKPAVDDGEHKPTEAEMEAHEAAKYAKPAPAGSSIDDEEFGKPSEAPKRWEDDTNGNGQYKVVRPTDGKTIGYTRVTTYIDALEDKTMLTKWKMRILLEGYAAAESESNLLNGGMFPSVRINDLVHVRDVAIAKARKADRKGKLVPGQLATIVQGAWGDFKRAMDALADELFELGGGREKATKGTDIHALCDLYDAEGIDAVGAKLEAGEITPSDLADVEAYARATKALGLKVVAAEQVIVHDDLKVAGRLDRVWLAKLPQIVDPKTGAEIRPADTRAKRYVGDLKTGNVEYSVGKIAQQIRLYAEGQAYDPDTGERSSHGANRTTGLLLHLPAGSGVCTIHVVDLGAGGQGNKIVGEVRAFRNTGKKAIDLTTDLVALAAAPADETAD